MKMTYAWGRVSGNTFTCKPIREFVERYLAQSTVSIDPFARNTAFATWRNDLDPSTQAPSHKDAVEFLTDLEVVADLAILDPPYSPRQIAECYRAIGRVVTAVDTQNARLYRCVRDAVAPLIAPGGVVLSFGWSSTGMGRSRGFEKEELLVVNHGGAHHDTLCIAERKAR